MVELAFPLLPAMQIVQHLADQLARIDLFQHGQRGLLAQLVRSQFLQYPRSHQNGAFLSRNGSFSSLYQKVAFLSTPSPYLNGIDLCGRPGAGFYKGDSLYMGFIMDGLDAETYDRTYADSQLVARIIGYFRSQLTMMLFVAVLVLLNSLMDTAYPLLIARSLDTLAADRSLQTIAILVAVILVTGIFSWIFNFLRQRYTARSVGNVVLNLQQDAFAAIVARDMSFYDEYPSGKIVSRVTSDTEQFATVVTLTLNLLSQLVLFFLIAAVLFYINLRLALLALTITPIIICIALGFRWIARRTTRRSQRSLARVNSNVQEVISGITVAKNFRQEQNMYNEFKKVARNTTNTAYHHFLIDFEGIERDSKEARREETEQLLAEVEDMVDLYEDK